MIDSWIEEALETSRKKYDEKKKQLKKKQRKNAILTAFITGFILYAFVNLMFYENQKSIDRCMSMGWSRNVCIKEI